MSELQSRIPAGIAVVTPKPFQPPTPAFGPGSVEYLARKAAGLTVAVDGGPNDEKESESSHEQSAGYAMAGQYF